MIDPGIKSKFTTLFREADFHPWAQRPNERGTIAPFYRFLIAQCTEDGKWYQVEAKMPVSDYLECTRPHSGQAERLDSADESLMLRLIGERWERRKA